MFPNHETIKIYSFSADDNTVKAYCNYCYEEFNISQSGYLYKNIIDDIDLVYSTEGLMGINKAGCELVKPIYDKIILNENNQLNVFQDREKGVIDFYGKEIVSLDCQDILPCGKNYYVVFKNNEYNLINTSGKQLLSGQENRIQYVEPDAFIIQDKKAASLFDSEGHLLFSKKF